MQLQKLKVSACYESETNPRGKDFEGAQFAELVASVKQKGVLVPILARPRTKAGKQFEIVAGNRRFRAAQKAGLEEIPAQVQEMTDVEAREAQIVENLQRVDIHPLEEGEAYRKLIEEGKNYDLQAVAAKVGKSVPYVRRRLILTDLTAEVKKAYRADKLNAAQAELIARLGASEQPKALTMVLHRNYGTSELREWIQETIVKKLSSAPPWKNHEALVAAAAPCEECAKKKGGDLFREGATEQCGDPTCFSRRMAAHIQLTKEDYASRKEPLLLVAESYRQSGDTVPKGMLARGEFHRIRGDKCTSAQKALIADGELDDELGQVILVCVDENCKTHGGDSDAPYHQSPKEIAARKRELARTKAKKAKYDAVIAMALAKVKWPLSEKHLNALLDFTLYRCGVSFQMPVVARHGLKAEKTKDGRSYQIPLRKLAEEGKDAKLRIILELLLPSYSNWNDGMTELKKKTSQL
jgi:ParB family chromosome partitioning protein